ncbi:uncharacterized protein ppp1r9ala [Aplochiton taeniatus]
MIKSESKGERTLRSASPHRNAYKSDFHAIKCSFDGSKPEGAAKSYANGSNDMREDTRGRPFGNRVNKIKNIFLQMDGQQQECQEVKATVKSEMPEVSPPKPQFPVSTPKSNDRSPSSPEPQSLEKPPKGEDVVVIDKVALAEKFSVTRKLFERGIKEQPSTEKLSSTRVVSRVSLGSVSDEVKSPRRVSASSEFPIKTEHAHSPTMKCHPDEVNECEETKHVSRVSLNAGPISRRLDSFITDSDCDNTNRANAKGTEVSAKACSPTECLLPTSPTKDTFSKPSSPTADATSTPSPVTRVISKPTSPVTTITLKPTPPVTNAALKTTDATHKPFLAEPTSPIGHSLYKRSSSTGDGFIRPSVGGEVVKPTSPPPRDQKPHPFAGSFYSTSSSSQSEIEGHVVHSPPRDKPATQASCLDPRGLGTVRAELVVVQNESSDSEENGEDSVFEELNVQSVKETKADLLKQNVPKESQNGCPPQHFVAGGVGKVTEPRTKRVDVSSVPAEQQCGLTENKKHERRAVSLSRDSKQEEEAAEEEESEEQEDEARGESMSPVVYGIENAAFVDDRDVDQILREEEEEEEEEEDVQKQQQQQEEKDEETGEENEEEYGPLRTSLAETPEPQTDIATHFPSTLFAPPIMPNQSTSAARRFTEHQRAAALNILDIEQTARQQQQGAPLLAWPGESVLLSKRAGNMELSALNREH